MPAATRERVTKAGSSFDPIPSRDPSAAVEVRVAASIPAGATVLGIPVFADGAVSNRQEFDRATLEQSGFTAAVGQALVLPRVDGPTVIEVGLGTHADVGPAAVRDAAAAYARAASRHADLAFDVSAIEGVDLGEIGQAVVEGVLLARYRYRAFVDKATETHLTALTLVTGSRATRAVATGARRGEITARAVTTARDLCNTPGTHLTARRYAKVAKALGAETGLGVEVFDEHQLAAMGCGGLLGVNAGSAEPARMIKLTYAPDVKRPSGHLGLVGKGIMYDAGGISLKPSDAMHAAMKLDMSGSAAILGAMTTLRDLGCRTKVTGWLMCTDNMPSGTATRLGDVLTMRGGKTVEVVNADAEGRLVMADALVLAEEAGVDAVVTVATLTGAAMRTFGSAGAALLANRRDIAAQLTAAGDATDEPVFELPLIQKYRPLLDSAIADLKNMGGENAGTITAALFLEAFAGSVPFGHLDICGPMMTDRDDLWRSTGANAFATRLLIDFALDFRRPAA
jgi:leucyl aminopeptidase